MARAVFNSSQGSAQGLDEFLQKHRPSEAEPRQYAWIQINAPAAEYVEEGDSEGAEAAWLGTEEKSIARIDAIAARFGVLGGKWLLFPRAAEADNCWNKIARAVCEGKLGHSAKISTSPEGGCYCVCVYTVDYRDATDVWRVRRELRDLGTSDMRSFVLLRSLTSF